MQHQIAKRIYNVITTNYKYLLQDPTNEHREEMSKKF